MAKYRPTAVQTAARNRYFAAAEAAGWSRSSAGDYWLNEARKFENRKRRSSSLFNELAAKFENKAVSAGTAQAWKFFS